MAGAKFNDFEVNPYGYAKEIKLSRELVHMLINSPKDEVILNEKVMKKLTELLSHYEIQREEGVQ